MQDFLHRILPISIKRGAFIGLNLTAGCGSGRFGRNRIRFFQRIGSGFLRGLIRFMSEYQRSTLKINLQSDFFMSLGVFFIVQINDHIKNDFYARFSSQNLTNFLTKKSFYWIEPNGRLWIRAVWSETDPVFPKDLIRFSQGFNPIFCLNIRDPR